MKKEVVIHLRRETKIHNPCRQGKILSLPALCRYSSRVSGFAFQPFIDRPICRIVLQPSDVPAERFKVRSARRICGDIRDAELFH
jgi:hypothetical protein